MVRGLIFDFNGVLVDDEPLHLELFQRVLGEEGLTLSRDDYYGAYLGFDDRDCFMHVLAAAGREPSPERVMRLIARKAAYYQERIHREGIPVFPGATELVREAAGQGFPLGVVSGALREEVEGALEKAGIRGLFKVLVTAEDVEQGKPSPEGYSAALAGLNATPPLPDRLLHPHEVAALEDSPAGLRAAKEAGLMAVGVAHTYPRERLADADWVVERLAEVDLERLRGLS